MTYFRTIKYITLIINVAPCIAVPLVHCSRIDFVFFCVPRNKNVRDNKRVKCYMVVPFIIHIYVWVINYGIRRRRHGKSKSIQLARASAVVCCFTERGSTPWVKTHYYNMLCWNYDFSGLLLRHIPSGRVQWKRECFVELNSERILFFLFL